MDKKHIYILAIESSCDDTSIAILKNKKILSNIISSQIIHKNNGGVIPEIASRAHEKNIISVCKEALDVAKIDICDISAIAFTRGPGLIGSLLVGISFAKSLSLSLNIPLIDVNHIQAHVMAHFIETDNYSPPSFPFLCLTVSGGHTQIIKVKDYFNFEIIGTTIDDACGEAFDKIGKILGLEYPSGAIIDKLSKKGDPLKFNFTKPKTKNKYDYSFSGLKSNFIQFLDKNLLVDPNFVNEYLYDICASIQKTIIDILLDKLLLASKDLNIHSLAIAGGVSANSELRIYLKELETNKKISTFTLKNEFTTDNAGMIGIVGYFKYLKNDFCNLDITPNLSPRF